MAIIHSRPPAEAALEGWVREHGTLYEAASAQPDGRDLQGRAAVRVVPAPDGPWPADTRWVVRHYSRGGAVARVLGDRYLKMGIRRPAREFRLIRALETLGIPTAPAVGAAVYDAGLFYRGDLVTEWVRWSRDLAAVLFGAGQPGAGHPPAPGAPAVPWEREIPLEAEACMRAAGQLVRRLHEAGVIHRDLNLKNILAAPGPDGPRALIIDLDRATLHARIGTAPRRRMLKRFERSLRKWEKLRRASAPAGAMAAFHEGYSDMRVHV